ncbi:kinase-like protein, partial [Pilatotrama ljubarskyi]
LQALAKLDIVHHDIKSGNVLIDVQGRALLSDLGLSRVTPKGMYDQWRGHHRSGTAAYTAPEMVAPNHAHVGHDAKVDVWSLG